VQHRSRSATVSAQDPKNPPRPALGANRSWRIPLCVAIAAGVAGSLAVVVTDLNPFDLIQKALTGWQGRRATPVVLAPKIASPEAAADPKARLGTDASASTVPLHLVLVRTIPGSNVHSGQAMLGADPAHPQTYLANAILENGARIDEIYADHVVLVRGLQHALLFVQNAASASSDATLLEVGGTPTAPSAITLSQETTTKYVRPVPEYENDVVVGFRIYPGTQSYVFSQLGLQAGDLLTAINGQPVLGADETMQLLQGLLEGQSLTATIRRGTQTLEISLDGAIVEHAEAARVASLTPPVPPS
jgi:general secretion pathway protein C